MKVSIVVAVLESYEVVRRQILYFRSLNLPDDVEIIFMDDGSDPPLKNPKRKLKNFNIYPTGDTRPWTQGCARNLGAEIAEGEFLLMTDIDHILPKGVIASIGQFGGDKMVFSREYAILDSRGRISRRLKTLFRYGLDRGYYKRRGLQLGSHANTFAMRREIFWNLGGYHPRHCGNLIQVGQDDRYFFNLYKKSVPKGFCRPQVPGSVVFTYPGLPKDPFKLFNSLPRYNKDGSLRND